SRDARGAFRLTRTSVVEPFRALALGAGVALLGFDATFLGRARRPGRLAPLRHDGGAADQLGKADPRRLAVADLVAALARGDDQHAVLGEPVAGELQQAHAHV